MAVPYFVFNDFCDNIARLSSRLGLVHPKSFPYGACYSKYIPGSCVFLNAVLKTLILCAQARVLSKRHKLYLKKTEVLETHFAKVIAGVGRFKKVTLWHWFFGVKSTGAYDPVTNTWLENRTLCPRDIDDSSITTIGKKI